MPSLIELQQVHYTKPDKIGEELLQALRWIGKRFFDNDDRFVMVGLQPGPRIVIVVEPEILDVCNEFLEQTPPKYVNMPVEFMAFGETRKSCRCTCWC